MILENKIALVTGGGRGIGRSIAINFAKDGAKVALAARTKSEINKVAEDIKILGGEAIAIQTDVLNEAMVKNLVKKTYNTFGNLDILVNNAGISRVSPILNMKTEDFDKVININLRGSFITTRECLKIFKKNGAGSIINMTSGYGIDPKPLLCAYSASKAALINFTKTLAKEVAYIKVYALNPGLIDTELTKALHGNKKSPEIIGPIASFLASDNNKLKSGTVVKRLQLDSLQNATKNYLDGKKYADIDSLITEIRYKIDDKTIHHLKKYEGMLTYIFRDNLKK
jgi:3-oxoacyl-[acyl-carrier protein] reductase